MLSAFLPVPTESLRTEFEAGATPDDVCISTLRGLRAAGVRHFYVSNLPLVRTASVLTSTRVTVSRSGLAMKT